MISQRIERKTAFFFFQIHHYCHFPVSIVDRFIFFFQQKEKRKKETLTAADMTKSTCAKLSSSFSNVTDWHEEITVKDKIRIDRYSQLQLQ